MKILTFILLVVSISAKANPLVDLNIGDDCTNIIYRFEQNQIKSDISNPERPVVILVFDSLEHTIVLECKDRLLTSVLAFVMLNIQDDAIDYYKKLHHDISGKFGKPVIDYEDVTDARVANGIAQKWIDEENKYTAQWETENQNIMIYSHKQNEGWVVSYSVDDLSGSEAIIR